MAATKRFMNWTGVVWTPSSGSPLTFTGVTRVGYDPRGSLLKFSGDNDRYNTTVVRDFADPMFSFTSADLTAVNTLSVGDRGTIVGVHNDAKNGNGAGSFAIRYSMICVVASNPIEGSHRAIGTGTVTLESESPDGQTSPMTQTVL